MQIFINLWAIFIGIFLYTLIGKIIVSFFEFLYGRFDIYFGMSSSLSYGDEYCPYNHFRYLLWPVIVFAFAVFELPIIVCLLIPIRISYYFLVKRDNSLSFSKLVSFDICGEN